MLTRRSTCCCFTTLQTMKNFKVILKNLSEPDKAETELFFRVTTKMFRYFKELGIEPGITLGTFYQLLSQHKETDKVVLLHDNTNIAIYLFQFAT